MTTKSRTMRQQEAMEAARLGFHTAIRAVECLTISEIDGATRARILSALANLYRETVTAIIDRTNE